MLCPNCQGADFETDRKRGTQYCLNCGHVLSDGLIVSELSFVKSSSGATNRSGTTVRTSEHRAVTVARAEDRLRSIAASLQIPDKDVESAKKLYLLALNHHFSTGRSLDELLSVCLYIICRRRNTPHLLIDFSEHLNINIFKLGHTFFTFQKSFETKIQVFDPSLFIPRFLQNLKFSPEKIQKISFLSTKIMKIFKEEWIHLGRKPFSLIAASIYIALIIQGESRSKEEICAVCNCEVSTMNSRLAEIQNTNFAGKNLHEIKKIDFDEIEKLSGRGKNLPSFVDRSDLSENIKKSKLVFSEQLKRNSERMLLETIEPTNNVDISDLVRNYVKSENLEKLLISEDSEEYKNKKILWEERFQDRYAENEIFSLERKISQKKRILRGKREKKEKVAENAEESVKNSIKTKVRTNFLEPQTYEIEQEIEHEMESDLL